MRYNTSSEFVGIEQLKIQQKWQLEQFKLWVSQGHWHEFHKHHYDWWMFPINTASNYGLSYTVYEGDIEKLKQDPIYINNYLRGVQLLALAWGWDLEQQTYISNPKPGQKWQHWPIRLYKVSKSLLLFGFNAQFNSLKKYALDLIKHGHSLSYRGRDLGLLFTQGIDPYQNDKTKANH